jgi:hypothetical protein
MDENADEIARLRRQIEHLEEALSEYVSFYGPTAKAQAALEGLRGDLPEATPPRPLVEVPKG